MATVLSQVTTSAIKKVCVIGPECSGKSELSQFLASHFNTVCVDEYARTYLDRLNRSYTQADLLTIAQGQILLEEEQVNKANKVLICDTNLIVIKVWSEYKYGYCNEKILKQIADRKYELYLLTGVDIPWQEDPQREHPEKRAYFWEIYQTEISQLNVPFVVITGDRTTRRTKAISAIEKIL